jgi:hypothetical protein
VLSYDADATCKPSLENTTLATDAVWPSSVCWHAPVLVSQSRTVLSSDADATCEPSLENTTLATDAVWPSSVCWHASH